jgi:hypothetical protein
MLMVLKSGGARGGTPRLLHPRAFLRVVVALLRPRQRRREHLRFGGKLEETGKMAVETRARELLAEDRSAPLVALDLHDDLVASLLESGDGSDRGRCEGQRRACARERALAQSDTQRVFAFEFEEGNGGDGQPRDERAHTRDRGRLCP